MSQDLIITQCIKYLDYTSKKYIADLEQQKSMLEIELTQTDNINKIDQAILTLQQIEKLHQEHLDYIKKLKQSIDAGLCRGLATCHAAMDIAGSRTWWEKMLVTIATWDGSEAALNNSSTLGGNLKWIFHQVINYMVYHHASVNCEFKLTDGEQKNMLLSTQSSDNAYFEILVGDKPRTIKRHAVIAGFVSQNDLLNLLDEKKVQGNICIVGNHDHAIRIGYNGTG